MMKLLQAPPSLLPLLLLLLIATYSMADEEVRIGAHFQKNRLLIFDSRAGLTDGNGISVAIGYIRELQQGQTIGKYSWPRHWFKNLGRFDWEIVDEKEDDSSTFPIRVQSLKIVATISSPASEPPEDDRTDFGGDGRGSDDEDLGDRDDSFTGANPNQRGRGQGRTDGIGSGSGSGSGSGDRANGGTGRPDGAGSGTGRPNGGSNRALLRSPLPIVDKSTKNNNINNTTMMVAMPQQEKRQLDDIDMVEIGKITFLVYLAKEDGEITFGGETFTMAENDVKFTIQFDSWNFCGNQGFPCTSEDNVEEIADTLEIGLGIKSKGGKGGPKLIEGLKGNRGSDAMPRTNPGGAQDRGERTEVDKVDRKVLDSIGDKPAYDLDTERGIALTMATNVIVNGQSSQDMADGYPKLSQIGGSNVVVLGFDKFTGPLVYDPTISSGRQFESDLNCPEGQPSEACSARGDDDDDNDGGNKGDGSGNKGDGGERPENPGSDLKEDGRRKGQKGATGIRILPNGMFTIYDRTQGFGEDLSAVTVRVMSCKQIAEDNVTTVGNSGSGTRYSFPTLTTQTYSIDYFSEEDGTTAYGLNATTAIFSTTLVSNNEDIGTLVVETYIFGEEGTIKDSDLTSEEYPVKPGDVKFNMKLTDFSYCDGCGPQSDETAAYVDVAIAIKGRNAKPTEDKNDDDDATAAQGTAEQGRRKRSKRFLLGANVTVILPTEANIDGNLIDMNDYQNDKGEFPQQRTNDNGVSLFVFRFPKFDTALYDPVFDYSNTLEDEVGTSSASFIPFYNIGTLAALGLLVWNLTW